MSSPYIYKMTFALPGSHYKKVWKISVASFHKTAGVSEGRARYDTLVFTGTDGSIRWTPDDNMYWIPGIFGKPWWTRNINTERRVCGHFQGIEQFFSNRQRHVPPLVAIIYLSTRCDRNHISCILSTLYSKKQFAYLTSPPYF